MGTVRPFLRASMVAASSAALSVACGDFKDLPVRDGADSGTPGATGGTTNYPDATGGSLTGGKPGGASGGTGGSGTGGVSNPGSGGAGGVNPSSGGGPTAGGSPGSGGAPPAGGGGPNTGGIGPGNTGGAGTGGGLPVVCKAPNPNCQCVTHSGHQYLFCSDEEDAATAAARCSTLGMRPIRINDAAENIFVATTMKKGTASWIGGTDPSHRHEWRWPDGALFWKGTDVTPGCPQDGPRVGDLCYFFTWNGATWANAPAMCAATFDPTWTLAVPKTEAIAAVFDAAMPSDFSENEKVWIGATDSAKEGEWRLRDGSPFWSGGSPARSCRADEVANGNSCYYVDRGDQSWALKRANCKQRGPGWDLATVNDAAEQNFVAGLLSKEKEDWYWIVLNDIAVEGDWSLSTGAVIWRGDANGTSVGNAYTNWADGEPTNNDADEDCGALKTADNGGAKWIDADCSPHDNYPGNPAVCEGPRPAAGVLVAGAYANWALGQPDDSSTNNGNTSNDADCAYVSGTGEWGDADCEEEQRIMCQGPPRPAGSAQGGLYTNWSLNDPSGILPDGCMIIHDDGQWFSSECGGPPAGTICEEY